MGTKLQQHVVTTPVCWALTPEGGRVSFVEGDVVSPEDVAEGEIDRLVAGSVIAVVVSVPTQETAEAAPAKPRARS